MTVEEMLATFQESLRAAADDDYDRSLDTADPRMTLVTVPQWPDGGTAVGPEAVWRMARGWLEVLDADTLVFEDPVAVDRDAMVVEVRGRLHPGDSDAAVDWQYGVLIRFRNARILRVHYFDTRQDALAAARDG